MCGIFGILSHDTSILPDKELLENTARLLWHRGPDGYGVYADAGIGMVHTRLALLDLNPRSDQPFFSRDGRYCLIYNGEIYNFKGLREELENKGVFFRTTSDTEVLLECIITYGVDFTLPRLEGMFAFALFDKAEKSLILARDRFGIKPLYVFDDGNTFIFASEIKAMRPYINFEPDLLSISSFLQGFGGPTKNHTFFKGIKILPPGTVVHVRMGKAARYSSFFSISDFWDENQADELKKSKPLQVVDKVEELLLNSVQKHLIADAPVGALCSGGVDSSLILAMASRCHDNLAIFHANVKGSDSEYEAALLLARQLKIDLKSVEVNDHDFIRNIPDVMEHYEHPFSYHPNSIPFLMVSELVQSNKVKAILSGEGSDECYLGYSYLLEEHPLAFYYRIPENTRRVISKIPKLRTILGQNYYEEKSARELIMSLHNRFEISLENQLLLSKTRGSTGKRIRNRDVRSLHLLNYHLRTLLHRNDCLGMAAGIEARFPFLDHDLVKFAVNMPYSLKIQFSLMKFDRPYRFLRDKWIIRQVAARYLPKTLSEREKRGFPSSAFARMRIPPSYFENSIIADLFELSLQEIKYLAENANEGLRLKLMLMDVWSHVSLNNFCKESITQRLEENLSFAENACYF